MELHEWAKRLLSAETMGEKLLQPEELTDHSPGPKTLWKTPSRPPGMHFQKRGRKEKLPPLQELTDPDKRAACLHRFCGHELLAVEIMAYVLLAFPEAPPLFRKALAHQLKEEQEHVQLYMDEMQRLGLQFGELPLYTHFWVHTPYIRSPLHFVSLMNLTFEMANLDFAPIYGRAFEKAGDDSATQLMARILKDEIGHVRLGLHWLKKFKSKELSEWDAWKETLETTLLIPKRAKGFYVHEEPRRKAGVPEEWIQQLQSL